MSNCSKRRWPISPRCRSRRVVGIVHDRRGAGFRALYDKAGLPASTFPAFREALEAMREEGFMFEPGNASRLKRRIIERTLTRCESEAPEEIEPLLTLLRRYAAEAAREEARLFCDELVADGLIARRSRPASDRGVSLRRLGRAEGLGFVSSKRSPPPLFSRGAGCAGISLLPDVRERSADPLPRPPTVSQGLPKPHNLSGFSAMSLPSLPIWFQGHTT